MKSKLAIYALLLTMALGIAACSGNQGSSGGTRITVTFLGVSPAAVAEQVGTDAWTGALLQNGQLSVMLPSGTANYSIAYVCPQSPQEIIIRATVSDGTAYTQACSAPTPTTGTATGSVDASAIAGAADVGIYSVGQNAIVRLGEIAGSFASVLPAGTHDLVFQALAPSKEPYGLAVKIVRSQAVPGLINGGNTIVFAPSDVFGQQTPELANIPAGFTSAFYPAYTTSNNTSFDLIPYFSPLPPKNAYLIVPSGETQTGDFYSFTAIALGNVAAGQGLSMTVFQNSPTPISTMTFPTPLIYSPPIPAGLPSFNLSYTGFSGDPVIAYEANIDWSTTQGQYFDVFVIATSAYQEGATTLSIPDLRMINGFLPQPSSGTQVSWSAAVFGGTYQPFNTVGLQAGVIGGSYLPYAQNSPAASLMGVQNSGSYVVP